MRSLARFDELRISGLLPASAALLLVVQGWFEPGLHPEGVAAIAMGLAVAGLLIPRNPLAARILASLALFGFAAITLTAVLESPAAALAVWIVVSWLLLALWVAPGLPSLRRLAPRSIEHPARLARARVALRATALIAVVVALGRGTVDATAQAALIASMGFAVLWLFRARPLRGILRRPAALLLLPAFVAAVLWQHPDVGEFPLVLLALVAFLASFGLVEASAAGVEPVVWWGALFEHPARQLVAGFAVLCGLGTLLLGLPISSATENPVAIVDAAFTAVSAVCVTGLVVLDTPHAWSPAGQVILLGLIQLGGLGIMTFATAFLRVLGQRLTLRQESAAAELTSQENRHQLYAAVKMVLGVTAVVEFVGAVGLTVAFVAAGEPLGSAVWRGVFTSVSAFCNAGFALQTDSLVRYAADPVVLHLVAALIVFGGLSPAILLSRRGRCHVGRLQLRLVLWTSAALLVGGALLFAAAEWNNTLAGLGIFDKLHNAWFQSVTLRTAGFNSVDIAALHPATLTLAIVWMFIGGSPGGTAGGIKTTTFAVLVLAVLATVRGQREISAFGRSVLHVTVYRAAAITTLGLTAVVLILVALQLTQDLPSMDALFEVVSATGTVGLSMGATGVLDGVGKIIIMVAMFAGRVGSLTMLVFLMARRAGNGWQRPPEIVDVG